MFRRCGIKIQCSAYSALFADRNLAELVLIYICITITQSTTVNSGQIHICEWYENKSIKL